uniref:Fibronectin type-III domain-containing protein n=1 Tax=Bubo bubo TaxID=30461 RepID=A0A8C0FLK5_BUBBB
MGQEESTPELPRWDSRLQLAPEQDSYKKNEEVMLSCTDGFQPSFTHVKCAREVQSLSQGKPIYREVWLGRNSRGIWIRIRSSVECIEVLQVVPETLEISSTSIKLNWTCRIPDACQRMQAMCRLAGPSSPPCEAEEVKGEEMLHGQEGIFTCPPLQPFTDYSVTISLPPSTILFTWLVRTKETVPDKPEKLWLDPNTGSLRWKALPSCKGEIIGYQLNITARSVQDGGFLEMERLRLSSSFTEHPLPEHSPGSSYVVTMQGLTAAGAGPALLWEFQTNSSGTPQPLDISCRSVRDISPSQGTAVLPLHPLSRPPEAAKEHQLIVAATHNSTTLIYTLAYNLCYCWSHCQDMAQAVAPTPGCVLAAGYPPGSWRGTVIGVVVLLALLLVSAGILWFVQQGHGKCQSFTQDFPLPFQEKEVFAQQN